jgi:hypothetical protein
VKRPVLERLLDAPHLALKKIFRREGDGRNAVLSMVELAKQAVRSRRNRRDAKAR